MAPFATKDNSKKNTALYTLARTKTSMQLTQVEKKANRMRK